MAKYIQDFLPGFLELEAKEQEKLIDETTRQLHLARQFCRFSKAQKLCKSEAMRQALERYKMETIKLMERT